MFLGVCVFIAFSGPALFTPERRTENRGRPLCKWILIFLHLGFDLLLSLRKSTVFLKNHKETLFARFLFSSHLKYTCLAPFAGAQIFGLRMNSPTMTTIATPRGQKFTLTPREDNAEQWGSLLPADSRQEYFYLAKDPDQFF